MSGKIPEDGMKEGLLIRSLALVLVVSSGMIVAQSSGTAADRATAPTSVPKTGISFDLTAMARVDTLWTGPYDRNRPGCGEGGFLASVWFRVQSQREYSDSGRLRDFR